MFTDVCKRISHPYLRELELTCEVKRRMNFVHGLCTKPSNLTVPKKLHAGSLLGVKFISMG